MRACSLWLSSIWTNRLKCLPVSSPSPHWYDRCVSYSWRRFNDTLDTNTSWLISWTTFQVVWRDFTGIRFHEISIVLTSLSLSRNTVIREITLDIRPTLMLVMTLRCIPMYQCARGDGVHLLKKRLAQLRNDDKVTYLVGSIAPRICKPDNQPGHDTYCIVVPGSGNTSVCFEIVLCPIRYTRMILVHEDTLSCFHGGIIDSGMVSNTI